MSIFPEGHSYRDAVSLQIQHLSQPDRGYSPTLTEITFYGFYVQKNAVLLWTLPFSEKPVLLPEDMQVVEVTDEAYLQSVFLPRRYTGIHIERERVPDGYGQDAIVERLYYMRPDGIQLLACIGVVSAKRQYHSGEPCGKFELHTDLSPVGRAYLPGYHNHHIGVSVVKHMEFGISAEKVEDLFRSPLPISLEPVSEEIQQRIEIQGDAYERNDPYKLVRGAHETS